MNNAVLIGLLLIVIYCLNNNETFTNFFQSNNYNINLFLTDKYCKEAENCIKTIEKIGLKSKIIVTCLDKESTKCMKELGVRTLDMYVPYGSSSYGTKIFYQLMKVKIQSILHLLNTTKRNVLYTDTDVVFLKDISSDIDKINKDNSDITFQCDHSSIIPPNVVCPNVCAGFMYIKNNKKTKQFFENVLQLMNKKHIGNADQGAINELLKQNDLNIKWQIFNQLEYPNGALYFNRGFRKNAKIVHNNYIQGLGNKIKRFKQNNLWFI